MEGICVNFIDQVQFFRFLKGRCHGNQFFSYQICLLGAEVSQDPLDQFSQSLHRIVDIEWKMFNPTFFYRYLKRRCHGNQFSGKNGAKLPTPLDLSLCHSETEWDIAFRICPLIAPLISLHSEKMVNIGSVVFELKWGRKWKLSCKSAKIGLYCRISQQLLNHTNVSAFVDVYMRIIKLT